MEENKEDLQIITLKENDAALVLRNSDQDSVSIELIMPSIDPVPPYLAALFVLTHKLHDIEFVKEQLDYLEKGIKNMEEKNEIDRS